MRSGGDLYSQYENIKSGSSRRSSRASQISYGNTVNPDTQRIRQNIGHIHPLIAMWMCYAQKFNYILDQFNVRILAEESFNDNKQDWILCGARKDVEEAAEYVGEIQQTRKAEIAFQDYQKDTYLQLVTAGQFYEKYRDKAEVFTSLKINEQMQRIKELKNYTDGEKWLKGAFQKLKHSRTNIFGVLVAQIDVFDEVKSFLQEQLRTIKEMQDSGVTPMPGDHLDLRGAAHGDVLHKIEDELPLSILQVVKLFLDDTPNFFKKLGEKLNVSFYFKRQEVGNLQPPVLVVRGKEYVTVKVAMRSIYDKLARLRLSLVFQDLSAEDFAEKQQLLTEQRMFLINYQTLHDVCLQLQAVMNYDAALSYLFGDRSDGTKLMKEGVCYLIGRRENYGFYVDLIGGQILSEQEDEDNDQNSVEVFKAESQRLEAKINESKDSTYLRRYEAQKSRRPAKEKQYNYSETPGEEIDELLEQRIILSGNLAQNNDDRGPIQNGRQKWQQQPAQRAREKAELKNYRNHQDGEIMYEGEFNIRVNAERSQYISNDLSFMDRQPEHPNRAPINQARWQQSEWADEGRQSLRNKPRPQADEMPVRKQYNGRTLPPRNEQIQYRQQYGKASAVPNVVHAPASQQELQGSTDQGPITTAFEYFLANNPNMSSYVFETKQVDFDRESNICTVIIEQFDKQNPREIEDLLKEFFDCRAVVELSDVELALLHECTDPNLETIKTRIEAMTNQGCVFFQQCGGEQYNAKKYGFYYHGPWIANVKQQLQKAVRSNIIYEDLAFNIAHVNTQSKKQQEFMNNLSKNDKFREITISLLERELKDLQNNLLQSQYLVKIGLPKFSSNQSSIILCAFCLIIGGIFKASDGEAKYIEAKDFMQKYLKDKVHQIMNETKETAAACFISNDENAQALKNTPGNHSLTFENKESSFNHSASKEQPSVSNIYENLDNGENDWD